MLEDRNASANVQLRITMSNAEQVLHTTTHANHDKCEQECSALSLCVFGF